jgi:glucosamine 6-phosphate synthetase-like amidotransferase/phosphosugar isomerase protein
MISIHISEFLVEGLTILKNRGYDSAGIATMSGNPSDGLVSSLFVVMFTIAY